MKQPELFGTTSFKLSVLYLGLFVCSFIVIGASVYVLTVHSLEQQLKNGIETEANRLKAEYDAGGLNGLIEEIAEDECGAAYLFGLIGPHSRLLAGTLKNIKPEAGWQELTHRLAVPDATGNDKLYIYVIALPQQIWLGVGDTGAYIEETGKAIIQAFLSGIVLVLMLGAGGGIYLSRAFLQKIGGITRSTEAIIAGDLKHRLPVAQNPDELDKLALLLNLMLDKIGALLENVQQVSNDIAHDLRTPISRMQFRLENALHKPLSEAQYHEQIACALSETDTILATFAALLRISQIEAGTRRSGFKPVNFSDIVGSVTDALFPVAEEQLKLIRADIDPDIILDGDQELLTQMVFNLLENAIVHTPEQTHIEIRLHVSGNNIELLVADSGPGIAEAYRRKVLQRFYRLDQSRTTSGNGLGLSIAVAVVELHGGTLTLLDNRPGLKVLLSFPAQQR
ncbi:MAG: HAMP domain-containing sensor histidine kinase [Methylovulum sp.]|nr:HAMP domain-containing sensor histidine kinase [Methylovulum sp.]